MKLITLVILLLITVGAHAQSTPFVPICSGANDTAKFTQIIALIGSNTGTIELPFKNGTRCAVNTLSIPSNIAIDNTNGTGLRANSGQSVTILGPVINPVGKPIFFGPGTFIFTGNPFVGTNGQSLVSNGLGSTSWQTVTGGGGGPSAGVLTFNGRDGAVLPAANDYGWAQINKTGSSLADLSIRSADELSNGTTGTGPVVLRDSASLISPTATSLNKVIITPPATVATLTVANNKTFAVNNTMTLAGAADGQSLVFPASGTVAMGADSLTVSSINATGAAHTHAVISSANPGGVASLLATNPSGFLQLVRLGIGTAPTQPLEVNGNVLISAAVANLFLKDASTGLQAANTGVITPQANNAIRSTDYTSGLTGWNVSALGNAEFNNVDVRGAIRASIFTYNAISATAGSLGTFKSAAKLRSDVVIPLTPTYGSTLVAVDVVDAEGLLHSSSQLFSVGDVLRLKDGLVGDTWVQVTSVSDQTTHWRYTTTVMAGSANVTYRAGLGVPDYGQSGDGFIIQTADQVNAPYLQMATHLATFSTQDAGGTLLFTPRLRAGNLNGSYGYNSNVFGFATGQYGVPGQSWLTVDPVNGVRIGNNATVLSQVDAAGNASFTGSVVASAGLIGNWTITASALARDTGVNSTSSGMAPADFPFFAGATVLNRATAPFRVTPAGALIATNATITGSITATSGSFTGSITANSGTIGSWTINSTSLSSGTTFLASGFDPPSSQHAWFGKNSFGVQGWQMRDTSGKVLAGIVNNGSVYPYISAFDGVRYRVVLGGLNSAFGSDGSTDSMGLKIWDASGVKLVEFSNTQNTIGNWVVAANSLTSGSGSSTVGLDATVTGSDDVRIYAGSATPSSAPFRVTEAGALIATNASITGSVAAGGGKVALDTNGISIISSTTKTGRDYKLVDSFGGATLGSMYGIYNSGGGTFSTVLDASNNTLNTSVVVESRGLTSLIVLRTTASAGTFRDEVQINGGIQIGGGGLLPTGGAKGIGTLNLTGDIYKNNAAYTNPDFVLERWATGSIIRFADKPGAATYTGALSLPELRRYLQTNYHLPRFGQQAEHGLFSGSDAILASLEEAYIYILQLEEKLQRLDTLEDRLRKLEQQSERKPQ